MIAFLVYLPFLLTSVLIIFYLERKIAAFMQDRLGPTHVGIFGSLQAIADLLKLIQKEDIIPQKADKVLFKAAPFFIFAAVFTGFVLIPISPGMPIIGVETGVFFLLAIISLDILGLLMAGWASNNKYALFGAMRSVAQIISYEIPVGLSVLSVVVIYQTLDLQEISIMQGGNGFLTWALFTTPHLWIAFIVFFIASLAECNRAPFDIPEAESELVAGFHVEYSGFRFAIFFLSEYAMMLLVSLLSAILFFGSWNSPFPNISSFELYKYTSGTTGELSGYIWGSFWLVSKAFIIMTVQVWVRWTFPRLRIDQLMSLSWKVLTPLAIILVGISAIWKLFIY
jgi:NADH-quinone oxidoreductase subunit H